MKYYFKFFNEDKEEKHILYNLNEFSPIEVNLNKFDVKIFASDIQINHDKVTEYKFIVERESNGVFVEENAFIGSKENELIKFKNCECKYVDSTYNIRYKCYLEVYEGGIVIYSNKTNAPIITMKYNCDNFYLGIYDSILIKDTFELQSEQLDFIKFKVELENKENSNTLMYYYTFSYNDKVEAKKFDYLKDSVREFNYAVSDAIFHNGETKLHFFMKDSFENVKYKQVKIITKHNTNELFEIIDYNQKIKNIADNICIFYNSKNISNIKPKIHIKYKEGKTYSAISDKPIGLSQNIIKSVSFNLSDHFKDLSTKLNNFETIHISFILNESNNETEKYEIKYDTKKPEIVFLNLENNYLKLQSDVDSYILEGQLIENNLFYVGSNIKKYDLQNISNNVIAYSEDDIYYIQNDKDEEKNKVQKFEKCYFSKINSKKFNFFNVNEKTICPKIILTDVSEDDQKPFFVYLNCRNFDTYERNLVSNNELCLVTDNENFVSYDRHKIGDYIIFKGFVKKEFNGELKFNIQIKDFDYSFIKYINSSNVSGELTPEKHLKCDFERTRILPINTNNNIQLKKFNIGNEISTKKNMLLDDISVFFLSLKENEFFTTDKSVYFLNRELNLKSNTNIYTQPVILNSKKEKVADIYTFIDKIDSGNYKFKVELPIENGINEYTFKFKDVFENESENVIKIEKQLEDIEISIDKDYSDDVIFYEKDGILRLTTNKKNTIIKLNVKNETLSDKENEKFVIVRSKGVNNKYKIIRNKDISYTNIEISNLDKEQEFNVYYETESNVPLLSFIVERIDSLFIHVPEKEIVTGSDFYHLKVIANDFAIVTLNYNKSDFDCSIKNENSGEKLILIKRNNNVKSIESLNLMLTTYDPKNIFKSVSKNINVLFYNDTFITDYWIDKTNLAENKLISPSFDLHIKANQNDFINSVFYYDEFEIDFYKRKKVAIYDKENSIYTIKNIISPLLPTKLNVFFDLRYKDGLVITKHLFDNKPIQLFEEEEKITISYDVNEKTIIATLKNHFAKDSYFDKIYIYVNGNHYFSSEDISFNKGVNHELVMDNKLKSGRVSIDAKLIKNNKILMLNNYTFNFSKKIVNAEIKNLKHQNIGVIGNKYTFILEEEEKTDKKYYINLYNHFGNVQKHELKIGENNFTFNEVGTYNMELYSKDEKNDRFITSYDFQIFNNEEDMIKLKNESVLKYDFVKEIHIANYINYDIGVINPRIIYYFNDDVEYKEIMPYEIKEGIFKFVIPKNIGINKYKYVDNFISKEIGTYEMFYDYENDINLYDIHTNNETIFIKDKNIITLEKPSNVHFKTKGIRTIIVNPYKMSKTFTKIILDEQESVISSAFLPCEIKCYDKSGNEITKFNYKILSGGIDEYKY